MRKLFIITFAATMLPAAITHAASPYLHKVYEFHPAPGQFVNELPEFSAGDSYADVVARATEQICGDKTPGMISLGACGGYVVFGFDHPVINMHGRYDFQIYGNAFTASGSETGGSSEPGIVMVSVDANGNGLPDDPWYELAGSDYHKSSTIHGYEITYYKPDPSKEAEPDPDYMYISDATYIRWTSSEPGNSEGYVARNIFHAGSYWPEWETGETLTFKCTKLADNYYDISGNGTNFVQETLRWGYVDNHPNGEYKGFSLDWAVDASGKPVTLTHADFIRVHTAVNEYCGWLGEASTEISGGEDLHPDAVYSAQWPSDPINPDADYPGATSVAETAAPAAFAIMSASAAELRIRAAEPGMLTIFAADGRTLFSHTVGEGISCIDTSSMPSGIYIVSLNRQTAKFAK